MDANGRLFFAKAVCDRTGADVTVFEGPLRAHNLYACIRQLQDKLKLDGLASAEDILSGAVRVTDLSEVPDEIVREALTAGMAATMERGR